LLSCSLSFLHCCADLLDLLSFPTRRSSDLSSKRQPESRLTSQANLHARTTRTKRASDVPTTSLRNNLAMLLHGAANSLERLPRRSEEHTSELQSRFELVCRLLLEIKNNNKR